MKRDEVSHGKLYIVRKSYCDSCFPKRKDKILVFLFNANVTLN